MKSYTFDELTERAKFTVIDSYAQDETLRELKRWSGYSCSDTFDYFGWRFTKEGERIES